MEVQFSTVIKNLPVYVQCTFANTYTEPEVNRGLCIRSFDARMLKQNKSTDNVIGYLTGNYVEDEKGVMWLESILKFTNRRNSGWFRERDIWHSKKGTVNPNPGTGNDNKKTTSTFLKWLTGGITLLSLLR